MNSANAVKDSLAKEVEEIRTLVQDMRLETELSELRSMFADLKHALKGKKDEGAASSSGADDRSVNTPKAKSQRPRHPCTYCNRPNHLEEQCWEKMAANGIMLPPYKGRVRVEPRTGGEKKNDPSTSANIILCQRVMQI